MQNQKKHRSDQTTTGVTPLFQNIPWYEISYHVVRFEKIFDTFLTAKIGAIS